MPTKTWEPAPRPSDTDRHGSNRSDEPRNFETARRERAWNHDARFDGESAAPDAHEDINTHGSER